MTSDRMQVSRGPASQNRFPKPAASRRLGIKFQVHRMFRHITSGIVLISLIGSAACAAAPNDGISRTAAWSLFGTSSKPIYDSSPGDVTPHPAVARIIVPEDGSTAFGSGTLVGVHD